MVTIGALSVPKVTIGALAQTAERHLSAGGQVWRPRVRALDQRDCEWTPDFGCPLTISAILDTMATDGRSRQRQREPQGVVDRENGVRRERTNQFRQFIALELLQVVDVDEAHQRVG